MNYIKKTNETKKKKLRYLKKTTKRLVPTSKNETNAKKTRRKIEC